MKMKYIFLVFCIFASIFSFIEASKQEGNDILLAQKEKRTDCPNDCSNHGTCSQGLCQCDNGWKGTDCSIEIVALSTNIPASGSVPTYGWNYYSIYLSRGGGTLKIDVSQSPTGDADLFVQFDKLPTRLDFRARDLSTNTEYSLEITNAEQGTWFIGVYGFVHCTYSITAHILGSCPNDCSNHGQCYNGNCVCNGGYSGDDCSVEVNELELGTSVTGSVNTQEFQTYKIHLITGNFLQFTLTHQEGSGDCDLYVRFDAEPTLFQWDYANVTLKATTVIRIDDARHGYWYAGVFGFQTCSFTIRADSQSDCPNKCSKRGSCGNSNYCTCNPGFSGDYCQTMIAPLTTGVAALGYAESNMWNYFTYQTNTERNLVVRIVHTPEGDCDLYAKAGSNPTRFNFDFQDIGFSSEFDLTIEDPAQAVWHFGVYGWSTCQFNITALISNECPNNCNGNGHCNGEGRCICDSGWTGDDCGSHDNSLVNGLVTNDQQVKYNEWVYYSVRLVNATSLHVHVKEESTNGLVWVYVAKSVPSVHSYLYSDVQINTPTHRIDVQFTSKISDTYIVGVYGNPYSVEVGNSGVGYSIVAWVPNF